MHAASLNLYKMCFKLEKYKFLLRTICDYKAFLILTDQLTFKFGKEYSILSIPLSFSEILLCDNFCVFLRLSFPKLAKMNKSKGDFTRCRQ